VSLSDGDGSAAGVDLGRLRAGRLERLQASMRESAVAACLLFNEPNVRYATGASAMPVWSSTTFVRCALVPAKGRPILFEHPSSVHRSRLVADDVRPMHSWEFYDGAEAEAAVWAGEVVDALRELGVDGQPLFVDRLGTLGFLALQREGVVIVDSSRVTQRAREVKTPEEIRLLELNGGVVVDMLTALEGSIAPGVRERDLLAVLAKTLISRGGEHLATNSVASGENTNPWRAEATDRSVEPGDLVWVDTDAVGVEGYFFCVSRTFLCGDAAPTPLQRDAYLAAHDWLLATRELLRPGISCAELAERAPQLPERYLPQRYECMVHGIGLEEESPSVCYPQDPQPNPDRVLEEGMALVVEVYAGEVGARDGVKLGDQVLVTADGPRILAPYPFGDVLL
jgi:Xaa-Pro aminopeptidase